MTEYLTQSPFEADAGGMIGRSPSELTKDEMRGLGHPESPIKAIRAKCLDCCGGMESEVRKCVIPACPLWPFRMGRNPFHARAK